MIYSPRLRAVLDMAVVVGALATIPLTVLQERGARSAALDIMDWAVWSIFAIELLVLEEHHRIVGPESGAEQSAGVFGVRGINHAEAGKVRKRHFARLAVINGATG